jgi:ketosteroid isomerase-like protein
VSDYSVAEWLSRYATAWEKRDPDAAAELFTEDSWYRRDIFGSPHEGREGVHRYWQGTRSQSDVHVQIGEPLLLESTVIAEWWTTMVSDGVKETVPGVLLLRFAPDGRCRRLREYAMSGAPREPFEGWGVLDEGDEESTKGFAERWARTWERSWRAKDPDPIVELYAEDAVYRSHPFREPHLGRAGARAYVSWAFGEEMDAEPRFAVLGCAGSVAAVEYWTPMVELDKQVTIAGCVLVTFAADGLVREQHEYWDMRDGKHEPPPEWGA